MRTTYSHTSFLTLVLACGMLLSASGCRTTSPGWGLKTPNLAAWNPWRKSSESPAAALAAKPSSTPPPSVGATPSPTGSVALAQNSAKPSAGGVPTAYPATSHAGSPAYPAQPATYQSQSPQGGYPAAGGYPPAGNYQAGGQGYPNNNYPPAGPAPVNTNYQTGPYNTGAGAPQTGGYPGYNSGANAPPAQAPAYGPQDGNQGGYQPQVVNENAGDGYSAPPASPRGGGAYGGAPYSGASYEQPIETDASQSASPAVPASNYAVAAPGSSPPVVQAGGAPAVAAPHLPSNLSTAPASYRPGSTGRAHAAGDVQQSTYEQPLNTIRR